MTAPLLSVRDLSVAFGQGGREVLAVDRVSFDVGNGETVALVGESGSGKSVTALSILKLLPYPVARHPSGTVTFKGQNLLPLTEREMRRVRGDDITIVFQEPMTSLNPLHTIEKQIGEILLLHRGLTGAAARARTIEVLTQVGIPDPQSRLAAYPHQLSGGQRQRVMIAMALANEPDLLIADEPTTALDVTVQAQIIALLKDVRKRLGMSLLFITHDLGIVRKLADRVCVMKEGKIVEQGTVERVFSAPEHPYTQALIAAEPKPDPAPPQPDAPMMLEATDLKVWFPIKRGVLRRVIGHIKAVDGVSIALRKGETLGVVGESGSGKTTLGLAILRLISSDGPVVFMGNALQGLRFQRDAAVPARHADRVPGPLRLAVAAYVDHRHHRGRLAGASLRHGGSGARPARDPGARKTSALDPETRFRFPHEFSGGQRQRIAVARARSAGADLHRARRADQRAGHADSGADGRSAARPAEAPQPHLSLHLARPARRCSAGEPTVGDAPRQGGGIRRRRRHCSAIRRPITRARCSPPHSTSRPRPPARRRNRQAMHKTIARLLSAALTIGVVATWPAQTIAQERDRSAAAIAEYPLTGDDGQRVANHSVKLLGPIDRLPGVVTVGNPNGKTTLVEFYDLNCPYCRIASADISDMVDLDRDLKLVLVPFPVLGIPSITASRVELAVAKLGTPAQFYAFHHKVYAQRGTTDGARALQIAAGLGFDVKQLDRGRRRRRHHRDDEGPRAARQLPRSRRDPGLHHRRRRHPRLSGPLPAAGDR